MADKLTTVYLVREFINDPGANEKRLDRIIDIVSDAIANHCGRSFGITTYKLWLDGTGTETLLLPEWPIDRLYGVSIGTLDALNLKHATAKYATVAVHGSELRLFAVANDGAETETDIAFSAQTTIADLAGECTGWTATVASGMGEQPSIMLKPTGPEYAVAPSSVDLQLADEAEPVELVPETDRMIRRVGVHGLTSTVLSDPRVFPVGRGNIFVWYKAGYTLPADDEAHSKLATAGNVPADLTGVATVMVKTLWDLAEEDIGADSLTVTGDYSRTLSAATRAAIGTLLGDHAGILTRYRNLAP